MLVEEGMGKELAKYDLVNARCDAILRSRCKTKGIRRPTKDASKWRGKSYVREWKEKGKMDKVKRVIIGYLHDREDIDRITYDLFIMGYTKKQITRQEFVDIVYYQFPDLREYLTRNITRKEILGAFVEKVHTGDEEYIKYGATLLQDDIKKKLLGVDDKESRNISIEFNGVSSDNKYGIDRPKAITKAPSENCPYCKGKGILILATGESLECPCLGGVKNE